MPEAGTIESPIAPTLFDLPDVDTRTPEQVAADAQRAHDIVKVREMAENGGFTTAELAGLAQLMKVAEDARRIPEKPIRYDSRPIDEIQREIDANKAREDAERAEKLRESMTLINFQRRIAAPAVKAALVGGPSGDAELRQQAVKSDSRVATTKVALSAAKGRHDQIKGHLDNLKSVGANRKHIRHERQLLEVAKEALYQAHVAHRDAQFADDDARYRLRSYDSMRNTHRPPTKPTPDTRYDKTSLYGSVGRAIF